MLLESVMPVTATVESDLTVTATVAVLPLWVLAVIVAVPTAFAVIVPFDTVATEELEVVQVTVLFVAFSGNTVAVAVQLRPTRRLAVLLESVMPVAGTSTDEPSAVKVFSVVEVLPVLSLIIQVIVC